MLTVTGYELGEKLHDGVRSIVIQARRQSDGLPVAIKMLRGDHLVREEQARLKREYEILRGIDVAGVIRPCALERAGGGFALVIEDFGARSLRAWVQAKRPSIEQVLEVGVQVARAIGEVHRLGVIHKDVNPANIVINPSTGEVKVIDFGISTMLSRETTAIRDLSRLEGTLPYLSPEQTGRMNRAIDSRTDLYSLGVTLYELATGTLPFVTSDPVEMVHCHIAREPELAHLRDADVPLPLSRVIAKLLAKAAEDRYQSAFGLEADLQRCLEACREGGPIPDFEPGQRDVPDRLQIAQRLYGREREVETLIDTFARVAVGRAELVLVAGYSGIGKTALIQEVQRPIVERRGYFAGGKFDQLNRDLPYSALIQAFGGLVRQVLTEDEARLSAWQERLAAALGPNGRVITDVIPDVELVIGPQPPVAALGPAESQNRWNLVFPSFVRCFASEAHPLVLFLDDLQWADGPSLKLISLLASDVETRHLLVLGAYRDNEVTATHPLTQMVDGLIKIGIAPVKLALGPLSLADVESLIVDTLRTSHERAGSLALLAREKTGGNPFFLGQFLKEAAAEGLLRFDRDENGWRWNDAELRARGITDNVVELMSSKIQRLPASARRALELGACIGSRFDLAVLAKLAGRNVVETAIDLWDSAREGLLVPLGDERHRAEPSGHAELDATEGAGVAYQFLHDRVQQAAYARIDGAERAGIHLALGRLLLEAHGGADLAEHVFDIVNQYNQGEAQLESPDERLALARNDLLAGRRAKAASAYESALRYLEVALRLLPVDAWANHYPLAFELHVEAMEAALLAAELARADALSAAALEHARTPLDKARVHETRMLFHTAQNEFVAAIDTGFLALDILGMPMPTDLDQARAFGSVLEVEALLEGRPRASLAELAAMTDPARLAQMRVLTTLTAPVYIARPVLFMPVVCELVKLSIAHGNAPQSTFGYAEYGLIRAAIGDTDSANEWGSLALDLLDRLDVRSLRAKIHVLVSAFITHFRVHLRESVEPLRESVQQGIDVGDFEFAGYGADLYCTAIFYLGDPLDVVSGELTVYVELLTRLKQEFQRIFANILHQTTQNLTGESPDPLCFGGPSFDEATDLQPLVAANLSNPLCLFHTSKSMLAFWFGDAALAVTHSLAAEPHLGAMAAHFTSIQHNFYSSLAHLALAATKDGDDRQACLDKVAKNQETMRTWAERGANNHAHKCMLVEAERARVEGRPLEAMDLYERAIRGAADERFLHEEAMAYELAAGLYLSLDRTRIAATYLNAARSRYLQWGAHAKVADLEKRHAQLLPSRLAGGTDDVTLRVTSTDGSTSLLDFTTVMKAARAISGEIVLDRLLANLMRIAIENAGAQRGFLLLNRDGALVVAAEHGTGQADVISRGDVPLAAERRLPAAIVNFVNRTKQSVVLDDAAQEGLFKADPYIVSEQPRSVLCLPLMNLGAVTAILYLENNLIPQAFTADRLELLRLLSSQAALSITNARLFADLGGAKARLEEHSRTLELKVDERTRELTDKNAQLGAAVTQLRETQRQLVTQEKLALVGSLTAGIAHELKNPLNFINNFALLSVELASEVEAGIDAETTKSPGLVELKDTLQALRGNVTKINEYGRRADGIINAMLLHSRQVASPRAPGNLNAVLTESVNLAYHGARAKDAGFTATLHTELDPKVGLVDISAPDLSRVFINIIDNAWYATKKKRQALGSRYTPALTVRTVSNVDTVEVRIRDNGPGIAKDVLESVFDPFFTTKPPGEGTGLGLSLSREIVVGMHDGSLEVESAEGDFTELVITLPRKASPRPTRAPEKHVADENG